MVQMPKYSPFVFVMFLATCGGLVLMGMVFLYGLVSRKFLVAKIAAGLAAAGVIIYTALLLGFSLGSADQTLPMGAQKYFCEVDCHIAISVASATTAPALGNGAARVSAGGVFHILRLRTWFDPTTTASFRGNAPLTPAPRRVVIVDDAGREYSPSEAGQHAYELVSGASTTPLTTPLRPGESFFTDFVFDLPPDIRNPRLLVRTEDLVATLLIGHELSPLHKKIYFALSGNASVDHTTGTLQLP